MKDFIDDWREVSKGANRRQGRGVGRAEYAAGSGEKQCVFDCDQGHTALVKINRQETVAAARASGCSRGFAVGNQDSAYILLAADSIIFHVLSSRFAS
jgi:hypothetical protein